MLCFGFEGGSSPSAGADPIKRARSWVSCPAGAEGAKQQRPPVADSEEKKSQISADSGLSVTSGSQVGYLRRVCAIGVVGGGGYLF